MVSISVVIPCRNNKQELDLTLKNLMGQLTPEDEVIVVDDGSSDGLRDMLEAKYSPPVKYIRIEGRKGWHLNSVRNKGIKEASNSLIYLLDADCIPQLGCVDALRANAGKGVFACGLVIYDVPVAVQERQARKTGGLASTHVAVGNYPVKDIIERAEMDSGEVRGTVGCNLMFHREDAEAVGFYSPEYNGCYGYGDADILVKMHFNGVRIANLKRALAYHQPRKVKKRERKWRARCLKKNRKILRDKIPSYRKGVFKEVLK